MIPSRRFLLITAMLLAAPARLPAAVTLGSLFSDHMVLQRGVAVPVWGTASPGEKISVAFQEQTQTTTARPGGEWMVHLSHLKTGGPFEMSVEGENTVTVHDVYVGEVWLASGQSNMEMTVAQEDRYWCGVFEEAEEVATANYPLIRMFKVKVDMSDQRQPAVEGNWVTTTPETVKEYSAAAYFFGRELFRKLDVPIGLIDSSYGASTAQAWTSGPALAANSEFSFMFDDYARAKQAYAADPEAKEHYAQALTKWKQAAAAAKLRGAFQPRRPGNPDPTQNQHNPSVLYNGMIAPLIPYAMRGVIWYQGESNGPTAKIYADIMKTLIDNWRGRWNEGSFPFLFVQLANHGTLALQPAEGGGTTWVREGQRETLSVVNTGMAVSIDIGDAGNIHPKNKQEVGRRLALLAQALVYHEDVPYSGPLYDSMTLEGDAIGLRFTHADAGLIAKGGKPIGFTIAGEDRKFVWADAKIEGNTIVVSSPLVRKPVAVRYGWADNPPANLYNKADLPASPFRTDSW